MSHHETNEWHGSVAPNGTSYSSPNAVGARASKLYQMLTDPKDKPPAELNTPSADMRRLALWLDCNSVFYGAYHDTELQAQGKTVLPKLR